MQCPRFAIAGLDCLPSLVLFCFEWQILKRVLLGWPLHHFLLVYFRLFLFLMPIFTLSVHIVLCCLITLSPICGEKARYRCIHPSNNNRHTIFRKQVQAPGDSSWEGPRDAPVCPLCHRKRQFVLKISSLAVKSLTVVIISLVVEPRMFFSLEGMSGESMDLI